MTLEPSLVWSIPIDDGPDVRPHWFHAHLQLRSVCFSWFWIVDTTSLFWDGISEGIRVWKWAALCVELARWKNWTFQSVSFTWNDVPESAYARDVLQTSALLAGALDVTLVREIDPDNLLGDLQTFRDLKSLVVRSGLWGASDIPFIPWSETPRGIWKQIQCLKELVFLRVHVPLSWLTTATHLRRLHLSWLAYQIADNDRPRREDIVEFSHLIATLEGLEELHVEGAFLDGDGTVERVVNSRLRDVRFAGFGRDVWLLLECVEVKGATRLQIEVRSDGYDGLVWPRVGEWVSGWDVCRAGLKMLESRDNRERLFEIAASPGRTEAMMTVQGKCNVRWRGRREAEGDMALAVVDVLAACGSMVVNDVKVGPLPANMEVNRDAWRDLLRLSPESRVLDVEWREVEGAQDPPTELHPLTQAFSMASDDGFWLQMAQVQLYGSAPEKDIAEWVRVVRQRDSKRAGRVDEETTARWRREDDDIRIHLEKMRKTKPWREAVVLRLGEDRGQWVVSTIG